MSVKGKMPDTVIGFRNWFAGLEFRAQLLVASVLFALVTAFIPGINFLGIGAVTASILFIIVVEVWKRAR